MCQAFQCLPQAGGLMDQDAFLIHGMSLVAIARAEKENADAAHKAAVAKAKANRKG